MRVEAETQREFELHNIGSPKLPKGGIFAGNGKLKHQAQQLGDRCITTHYRILSKSGYDESDKPSLLFA